MMNQPTERISCDTYKGSSIAEERNARPGILVRATAMAIDAPIAVATSVEARASTNELVIAAWKSAEAKKWK